MRRLLAAALIAAGVAVTATADGAGAACEGHEVLKGERGTWSVAPAPRFAAGEQRLSAHTVDRYDPRVHFATNGVVIVRSVDGACSWQEVFRLPDSPGPEMPVSAETGRIEGLQAARTKVIATIAAPGEALPESAPRVDAATVVARSPDGGDSWPESSPPVLPGAPGPVAFSDDEGEVWLATGALVHRSIDDGDSFVPVTPPGSSTPIESLVASVTYITGGDMVWAQGQDGTAFRTLNEGSTWTRYERSEVGTDGPALQPVEKGDESRIAFFDTDPASGQPSDFVYSQDQGATFKRFGASAVEGTEGAITSVDGEQRRGDIVLTTTEGVYRFHPRVKRMVSIDEYALGPMRGATAAHTYEARVSYRFHSDTEIFTYEETEGGVATLPIPGALDHVDPAPEPATLVPSGGEVPVPAGGSRSARYRLDLSARSTRLDTFFVLDTSNSTEGYIHGLRIGITKIARGLAKAGVEGRYGLGEYQDNGATNGVRYARRADIGGADRLRSALSRLGTNGGEEPGYTAIREALKGKGVAAAPAVEPGQAATWRPRAVRTLVLVADESFAHDPPGASRDEAVAALRGTDVTFVGIVVQDPKFDPTLPGVDCATVLATPDRSYDGTEGDHRLRCQLEDLARAAGSVAPAGGTDCDGDGRIDIAAGAPLVCTLPSEDSAGIVAVADPLRRLLLAVTDEQPVALRPAGDGAARAAVKAAGDFSRLDLKKAHALEFDVRFSCAREDAGERFPLRLEALVAGQEVAAAAPTIVCGTLPAAAAARPRKPKPRKPAPRPEPEPPAPVAPAPPAPVPAPPVPAPVPVPAVVVPPATVPPPALASAPAPAPAGASASAPAVAVADRPQTQAAATLVHAGEDDETLPAELHFAARAGGAAAVLGGLLVLWPSRGAPAPGTVAVSARQPTVDRRRRRRRR